MMYSFDFESWWMGSAQQSKLHAIRKMSLEL